MRTRRLGDLMLIIFPLLTLIAVLWIFHHATSQLDQAWQEQVTTP